MTVWTPVLMPRTEAVGPAMSLDEWAQLPEDEPGELVDGHLAEEEMPDPIHELAVTWLVVLLGSWLKGRGGFVFGSELKVKVTERGGRKPDLSVVLPGSTAPPRRRLLQGPPDIAVEVVTATPRDERRDRVDKMTEYALAGIGFYWIVDPSLGSFEVFELGDLQRYVRVLAATKGTVAAPGCEGLLIDLDALWSELDRLGPE
jgi:Uma2 family endonuclease